MKTTLHKVEFDLPEVDDEKLAEIESWLSDKYGSHEQLVTLKVIHSGLQPELHIEYSFSDFEDAKKFYRRVIFKMLNDLEGTFNARIAGQSSVLSDLAD